MGRKSLRKPVTRRTLRPARIRDSVAPASVAGGGRPSAADSAGRGGPSAADSAGRTLRPIASPAESPGTAGHGQVLGRASAADSASDTSLGVVSQAALVVVGAPTSDTAAAAEAGPMGEQRSPARGTASTPPSAPIATESHAGTQTVDRLEAEPETQLAPGHPDDRKQSEPQPDQHHDPHHDLHHDEVYRDFFSAGDHALAHADDDHLSLPMQAGPRRAMYASLAMFALFGLGIAGYLVYHKLIMPTPVAVGDTAPLTMETFAPAPLSESEPVAQAERPKLSPSMASDSVGLVLEEDSVPPAHAAAKQSATPVAPPAPHPAHAEAFAAAGAQTPEPSARLGETVSRLITEGKQLQERGRGKQALAKLTAALGLSPDASDAMSRIALIHLEAGQMRSAREFAERAIVADARNAEGYIVLGAAKQALKDRVGARQAYAACAELDDSTYSVECRRMVR